MSLIHLYELITVLFILLLGLLVLVLTYRHLLKNATKHQIISDPQQRELVRSFGSALAKGEFSLRFQPKISVKTGRICGAEVLVRWNHPKYGMIHPEVFITLAEKSGFIVPLGQWILKNACEQAKELHTRGHGYIRLSVNLSAQQFKIGDVVKDIAKLLDELSVSPQMLEVELTETVFLNNSEKNLLMLKVLREMGVMVSLDDFGTGYSSLKYLREFPLDALKIDKTFVHLITENAENVNIIKAMISLAKAMHMKTIAEGVETLEEARLLAELGVDELQGYYFFKPLTVEKFFAEVYLEAREERTLVQQ